MIRILVFVYSTPVLVLLGCINEYLSCTDNRRRFEILEYATFVFAIWLILGFLLVVFIWVMRTNGYYGGCYT